MKKSNTLNPQEYRKLIAALSDEQLQTMLEMLEQEHEKPGFLEVSGEEQKKISEIMSAFQDYIDSHRHFDIFYSKKFGYYRLDLDGLHDQFNTADGIMYCLIEEFYLDVRDAKIGGPHMTIYMRPAEELELRNRITPYIEKLSDSEHYFDMLNAYIDDYRKR